MCLILHAENRLLSGVLPSRRHANRLFSSHFCENKQIHEELKGTKTWTETHFPKLFSDSPDLRDLTVCS